MLPVAHRPAGNVVRRGFGASEFVGKESMAARRGFCLTNRAARGGAEEVLPSAGEGRAADRRSSTGYCLSAGFRGGGRSGPCYM